jgi:YegS/Rv2252/BmrU family lipid kinase
VKKRIAFIVNPISGKGEKSLLSDRIEAYCTHKGITYTIAETEGPGHASALAEALAEEKHERIAVVGGDGSVNEVARGIIKSGGILSIIPAGSGNGLARHLGIPLQLEASIDTALEGEIIEMDYGLMQGLPFFVTCGIGFDADIAHAFANGTTRGLLGYMREIMAAFPRYQAQEYTLQLPEKTKTSKAFTITVANASQYGNRAVIAAGASVTDGLLDVCVIKNYPKIFGPHIGLRLFLANLHNSSFYRHYNAVRLVIETTNRNKIKGQIDGEPIWLQSPIEISVVARGVRVTIPKDKRI